MRKLKYKLNIYRRYPYWKKANCIFIHVPKAAGTSVSKCIYGRALGHYTATEVSEKFPGLYSSAYKFSFVRNPWDRVLSAYRFAKVGRTESMGIHQPAQYKIPEFNSFESFIFEWLLKHDVNLLDGVFQPQHQYLLSKQDQPLVDFIGSVEHIDMDIKTVEEKIGKKLNLPHVNKTAHGGHYRDAYSSDKLIDAVKSIYSKDIEIFDYEF